MKERPILFNTEMVKAILDGRKTQTRRPANPQPTLTNDSGFSWKGHLYGAGFSDKATKNNFIAPAFPLGKVGDHLWVRETFAALDAGSYEQAKPTKGMNQDIRYKATEKLASQDADVRGYDWKPSIHMPRWACRLVLEITDVRIERIQDITEEDAKKEGFPRMETHPKDGAPARTWFRGTWDSLYKNWSENPWVWIIEFKIVELNGKKQEQAA
ncbi:ASCH domain-containing protein [Marinomonas shanghaiensis]|uniref:ASCH domain-containing protein n=1 Tax=Marinomonas shanghaiensis TaxID=2202418 RepID=UPI000DB93885|nr:ASCH domain-containing protein [Marinomonas shanghaiensis]